MRLKILSQEWKIKTVAMPGGDDHSGFCNFGSHEIELQTGLSEEAYVSVLLHEIAHAYWFTLMGSSTDKIDIEKHAQLFSAAVLDVLRSNRWLAELVYG